MTGFWADIDWPYTAADHGTGSVDLLSIPFDKFDQSIHWEATVWFDPELDSYGVTFWEPDLARRAPEHISDLTRDEATAVAIDFARNGGITDFWSDRRISAG